MRTSARLLFIVGFSLALAACTAGQSAVERKDSVQLHIALNVPNRDENLARLMYVAIEEGATDCVRELLDAPGAKTDPSTFHGIKATDLGYFLGLARAFENEEIAQLIIAHGAKESNQHASFKGAPAAGSNTAGAPAFKGAPKPRVYKGAPAPVAEVSTDEAVADAAPTPSPRLVPSFQSEEHPDDYALIIGVEKYTDLPAATYAENDARAMGDFVRAMGVPARNVEILTGARATRSGMLKNLESWLANNVNENSTVYFYYSGHGAPEPATGQAYLVPLDGDPQYLADTGYPLKRLYEKLGALKAKRVVVMLDSCFSGAGGRSVLAKGARPLVNQVDTGFDSADGKIEVLTASGPDQISGTNDDSGHGLFTYHLLTGLNGAAEDAQGRVTLKSLYAYLRPKVMDDAHRANREQTPQLQSGGGDGADVVLRKK